MANLEFEQNLSIKNQMQFQKKVTNFTSKQQQNSNSNQNLIIQTIPVQQNLSILTQHNSIIHLKKQPEVNIQYIHKQDIQIPQKNDLYSEIYYNLNNSHYKNYGYKYLRISDDWKQDQKRFKSKLKRQRKTEPNDKLEQIINNWKQTEYLNSDLGILDESIQQKLINHKVKNHILYKNPFTSQEQIKKNLDKLETDVQQIVIDNQSQGQWLPPLEKFKKIDIYGACSKKQMPKKSDELCINVLNFNETLSRRKENMKCVFESYNRSNSGREEKKATVHKVLNKVYQANIIIDEFQRLKKIDLLQIIKMKQKNQQIQNLSETEIMKETFLNNSAVFFKYIKNNKEINNRILQAIHNDNELLDFDSLNNFYRILIFRNAEYEQKVTFMAKFIRYKTNRLNISQIMDVLAILSSDQNKQIKKYNQNSKHNSQKIQQKIEIYEQNLERKGYFDNLDKQYRLSEIEKIFTSGALNIDEILFLLYKN